MTRGKYAARASNRREAAEVEASEAAYQRQIVRLTKERDEARAALAKLKADSAAESRKLRAQISEGTSDLTEALRRSRESMRAAKERAEHEAKQANRVLTSVIRNAANHLMTEHGMEVRAASNLTWSWGGKRLPPPGDVAEDLAEAGFDRKSARDGRNVASYAAGWDEANEFALAAVKATAR